MSWHESVEAYVATVCKQVRWKRAHLPIAEELAGHIADQAAAYGLEGLSKEEARAKAVAAMGDPVHTGTLLDASYRPQLPWPLLFSVGGLVILGLIIRTQLLTYPPFGIAEALALLFGLAGFLLIYNLDWRLLLKTTWPLYGGLVFLSLLPLLTSSFSRGIRDDHIWLMLFGRGYSLTPCLLLFFPVVYGLIIYRFRGKGLKHVLLCGALFCLPGFLWIKLPDMDRFLRAALPCLILLTIAILGGHFDCPKAKALLFVWGGTLAVVLLGALWAMTKPHVVLRLQAALPGGASDPQGAAYLPALIRGFLEHAKLFGTGEVTKGPTLDILERYTQGTFQAIDIQVNFALTLFIHRYGWWVLIALCGFLCWLFFLLFRACVRQGSMLGKLLGYGASLALLMQFLGYIISNLGFVLFDPLPLPFLSAGNSALMVDLWLVGLLTAVLSGGATLRDGLLWRERAPAGGFSPPAPPDLLL